VDTNLPVIKWHARISEYITELINDLRLAADCYCLRGAQESIELFLNSPRKHKIVTVESEDKLPPRGIATGNKGVGNPFTSALKHSHRSPAFMSDLSQFLSQLICDPIQNN
jgi:hypothetical protein